MDRFNRPVHNPGLGGIYNTFNSLSYHNKHVSKTSRRVPTINDTHPDDPGYNISSNPVRESGMSSSGKRKRKATKKTGRSNKRQRVNNNKKKRQLVEKVKEKQIRRQLLEKLK